MSVRTPARRAEVAFLTLSALLLPTLTLLPLGSLYLWERGWFLNWAIATFALIALVFLAQRITLSRANRRTPVLSEQGTPSGEVGAASLPQSWTPIERLAWADVQALSLRADTGTIADHDAALNLARETIETVARRLHPETHNAVWQFTVPEALAIGERVSRRLSQFVATHVPFGDRMTVSQMLQIYRARSVVDTAGKVYDIWRVIRMANPATAITHEMRERLTKAVMTWGRDQVSRRLLVAYVEEVGRAAIDLYGGRLRPTEALAGDLARPDPSTNQSARPAAQPKVPVLRQLKNSIRSLARRPGT